MILGDESLERRRQRVMAEIVAQRAQLVAQINVYRAPLQAFEIARDVGTVVRRHAMLVGVVGAGAAFLMMRGGWFSKAIRTFQLVQRTTRWLAIARMGWQLVGR